jgi:hypothetical protein
MMKSRKRRNTAVYIEDCVKIHGNVYNYSLVQYTKMHNKVKILCKKHGLFEQTAKRHLEGHACRKCAIEKQCLRQKDDTKNFIKKAKAIHGNIYNYDKTVYGKNAHQKVVITCKKHGDFFITPNSHLSKKSNCLKCGREKSGWTRTSWEKACTGKTAKLYVLKCELNEERFYKIGITSKDTIKGRYGCIKQMPYHYEIEHIIKSEDPVYIFNLEKELHRKNYQFKYTPKVFFDGFSECFSSYVLE